jgi:hypothetical protein
MPYVQDAVVFRRLVDQVLTNQDIRERIENAEVNEGTIVEFLEKTAPDIWASAAPRIAEYNDAEKKAASLELAYKSLQDGKPFYLRLVQDILPIIFALLVFSLFSLFSATVRHLVYNTLFTSYARTIEALGLLALVATIVWAANRRKSQAYIAALAAAKAAHESSLQDADKAKTLIEPAVVTGIEALIGEHLDEVAPPAFRLDLPETDTSGLSEVHNQGFEIITDGRRYVRGLIERMSGGSIGIAGPRGCGKTTLLRSFWREGEVDPKKLSIFASAPVRYEPREFLLHLFTALCSHVIAKETKTEVPPAWTQMDSLRKAPTPRLLDTGVLASLSLIAALFLLFTGFFVAVVGPIEMRQSSTPASTAASQTPQKQPSATSNPFTAPAVPYFIWGVAALIIGTAARLSPGQPKPTNVADFYFAPWIRENQRRKSEEEQQRPENVDLDPSALIQRARRTLLGLRFQQSYSSGWSGTLKLPIGLEGGANAAVSFAESQLSLPEVVNEYRGFVKAAAKRYGQILVAIDELDKLGSDDEAKTFLNSIKAIFGQEKVYYLVSISENAMSNFERRGLPIRDEFDSSFDDAVYIGYLDFAASRRLLARRASEPPPDVYRAFCHVLSGGLPRDLIRYCRKLYEYRRASHGQSNTVATTCPALVGRDIRAKLDAIRHNLQRVPDEKKTVDILALISTETWDQKTLRDTIVRLDRFQSSFESEAANKNQAKEDSGADLLALANILEEISAYLCFSLAVTETFASITSEAVYNQLQGIKAFDRLAAARQLMAVNRAAAIATIAQVVPLPLPLQQAEVPADVRKQGARGSARDG